MKKKIKIGIELDDVLRNKNKQLLKYYCRDINSEKDPGEVNEKNTSEVEKVVRFDNLAERNRFIYIDYPFELFGCATVMENNLATTLNNWLEELTNADETEFHVEVFGRNEEALTIQSSYFFLSKTGCRVRSAFFPKDEDELIERYDAIFTADKKFSEKLTENGKNVIFITQENEEKPENTWKTFKTMTDALEDDNIINELQEL